MFYLLIALIATLAIFVALLLIRAARFKPPVTETRQPSLTEFDGDAAADALGELVRCKTVSYRDSSLEDDAEFERLISSLVRLYPRVFETCEFMQMKDRALLFKWKGRREGEPAVLMAHYDVVPADEDKWEKPPFEPVVEDGVMWGRGTLDTKVTVNGILFAAETLISKGFTPESDIYFAFSGGEEINGPGAAHIVDYFREKSITPAFVLDEGGAVVTGTFPGVSRPCALVGIAEKGILNLRYEVRSEGGHASAPARETPIVILSRACDRVSRAHFKSHLSEPADKLFDTLGRHSNFIYRIVFANRRLFLPLLDAMSKKSGGELNALLRTTVAFTQMSGSNTENVIPTEARMVSNVRLNPEDTVESATEHIRRAIKDERVKLTVINATDPSRISRTDTEGYEKLSRAIEDTWNGAVVSPYLMLQCSDSRHYGAISDRVYRFSAMALTAEERATIHGNNERITLDAVSKAVEFYIRVIKQL